jgi:SNF2 family DNA or RNA helicase
MWRQGQKNRIVVHHVIARNTVDEAVMAALQRKDGTQRGLMDALKDYVSERS